MELNKVPVEIGRPVERQVTAVGIIAPKESSVNVVRVPIVDGSGLDFGRWNRWLT
jgi:hypothetical protein